MPITLQPGQMTRGQVPAVPKTGIRTPHNATVVVQPATGNPTPNFSVVIRFGELSPSTTFKDIGTRQTTGKTTTELRWYNTTTWSYPGFRAHPWNGTRTFDLNGADPGDIYEIENQGQTNIDVTYA